MVSAKWNTSLSDFCGLKLLATKGITMYEVIGNSFNPTREDILNGNCSK